MEFFLNSFVFLFITAIALYMIVPFLRGKSDLFSFLGLFLAGSANFVGVSLFNLVNFQEPRGEYRPEDYAWFITGVIVFFSTLLLVYRRWKLPAKVGGRVLLSWPPATPTALFLLLFVGFLPLAVFPLVRGIPFVQQVVGSMSLSGPILATVLAVSFWFKAKLNPIAIGMVVLSLACAGLLSVAAAESRRPLLSVVASAPMTLYWLSFRYRSRGWALTYLSIACFAAALVVNGYSHVRHIDRGLKSGQAKTSAANKLVYAFEKAFDVELLSQSLGQDAANNSLLLIEGLRLKRFEPQPLHYLTFLAANPVPRVFWPEKPRGLGFILPQEIEKIPGKATWGPGIVGHAFYEGGVHILVLYGALVGAVLRFFDTLIELQPNNPYLIGFVTLCSGHLMGWTRGDIGTFTMAIVGQIAAVGLIVVVGRVVMGSGLRYLSASDRATAEYWMRYRQATAQR